MDNVNTPKISYANPNNPVLNLAAAVMLVEGIIEDEPGNQRAIEYLAFLKTQQLSENQSNIKIVKKA
jgi:hypothetical protein